MSFTERVRPQVWEHHDPGNRVVSPPLETISAELATLADTPAASQEEELDRIQSAAQRYADEQKWIGFFPGTQYDQPRSGFRQRSIEPARSASASSLTPESLRYVTPSRFDQTPSARSQTTWGRLTAAQPRQPKGNSPTLADRIRKKLAETPAIAAKIETGKEWEELRRAVKNGEVSIVPGIPREIEPAGREKWSPKNQLREEKPKNPIDWRSKLDAPLPPRNQATIVDSQAGDSRRKPRR